MDGYISEDEYDPSSDPKPIGEKGGFCDSDMDNGTAIADIFRYTWRPVNYI